MNYTVYLSSTLKDLETEREAVRQALSDECVIKHSYLANERALVGSCLEDVANCDAYILILGLRYGYVPEAGVGNPTNLSITELEYERASNKPRLVFIKDEGSIPFALTDAKTKEHPLDRIESFRRRAGLDQRAAVFKTADDLKLAIVKAFNAFREDREIAKPSPPEVAESRSTARMERLEQGLNTRIGSVQKTQGELVVAIRGIPSEVAKKILDVLAERHYRLESEQKEGVRLSRSLPQRPPRCIGRKEDIERLTSHLDKNHPRTALFAFGGPGVGKSTLICEVDHRPEVQARYGDRILFMQLEEISNPEDLLRSASSALNQPPQNSLGQIMAAQGTEPTLLILDNCETLWESDPAACEKQLKSLQHLAPSTALTVTFRGTEIPAGFYWTLRHPVLPLTDNYDRALFLEIAPRIAQDDPHLHTFLAELGGIPLAIELVAFEAAPFDRLELVRARWQEVGTRLANRRRFAADRTTRWVTSPSHSRKIVT